MNKEIKFWINGNLPDEYRFLLNNIDEECETFCFAAHVPKEILNNEFYQYISEVDHLKLFPMETFGANALDLYSHPDGDGHFIVGRMM